MTVTDDMWTTASADLGAEQADRLLAVAQVRCATLWPFLAGAGSEGEYAQRRALAIERVEAACDSVSPGDPELLRQVLAGLDADFRALHSSRAPERELARQVQAELAVRRPALPAPTHSRALAMRHRRVAQLRQAATQPAPPDPEEDAQAELDEAAQALPEPLSVGAPRTAAWGSGTADVDCPKCGGTGTMPSQYLDADHRGPAPECDECDGEGAVPATEAHAWHSSSRTAAVRHTAPGGGEHAPYRVRRKPDGEYEVVNDLGEVKGTHPTKGEARDQQQALYADVPGARGSADEHRKAASRRTGAVMRDIRCASCGRQARVDISRGTGASPTPCPHCGSTEVHLADTTHNRYSGLRATCAKCVVGCTPDGATCSYCDGAGELDPTTAMIKAADGWDQGLVRLTATGAVSFDPQAFGSERWQKLPATAQPAWIVDQWGPANVPLVGAEPNPLAARPAPSGRELSDTRSYRPPVRATRKQANPYLDDNPYRSAGPGVPGPDQPPAEPGAPGEQPPPEETRQQSPPEVPLASGAAQPLVNDQQLPRPVDDPTERRPTSARRPAPEFGEARADVVDRLAARVLAANAGVSPADARRVARATLRRFPAVAGGQGR